MAGAKGKNWARAQRGRGEEEAPAASALFIWSFSFADERKIAIGSFLINCVKHCLIRPSDWSRCFGSHLRMKIKMADALERDREPSLRSVKYL